MSEDTSTNTPELEDTGRGYATYNGMGREALAWGIPVVPFAFCLLYLLVSGFGGAVIFGPWGASLVLPGLALMFYLRAICETDSRAIRLRVLLFKRLLVSIRTGSITILITPLIYQRRRRSTERFLQSKKMLTVPRL
ncbi:VirB3 family type IV secretion system protein [Salmonella enterica]